MRRRVGDWRRKLRSRAGDRAPGAAWLLWISPGIRSILLGVGNL